MSLNSFVPCALTHSLMRLPVINSFLIDVNLLLLLLLLEQHTVCFCADGELFKCAVELYIYTEVVEVQLYNIALFINRKPNHCSTTNTHHFLSTLMVWLRAMVFICAAAVNVNKSSTTFVQQHTHTYKHTHRPYHNYNIRGCVF